MTAPTGPAPRRLPIVATVLVLLAMAVMVWLGVWQLHRADEKHRLLATYAANVTAPPTALTIGGGPVPDALMYRHAGATCVRVTGWTTIGGRSASGETGFRRLALCTTGAEGPGFVADMGVSTDPGAANPAWTGGPVSGVVTREPVEGGLWADLTGHSVVPRAMIVSTSALPGLSPSAAPDLGDVSNNHLAYAVQWFIFAGVAGIIYLLALRQRWRRDDKPPPGASPQADL